MFSCGRNNVGDSALLIRAVKVEPDAPVIHAGNTDHPSSASESISQIETTGLHIRAILKEQNISACHT
jgi:hypothetical protein